MPEKYLPIGSIVTVNGLNKKMMIIGYYSLEYQNSVTMYDYVGCAYPEGLLVKNNMFSFNHTDITKVEFVGFSDESYTKLNNNLNNQLNNNDSSLQKPKSFVNLKFDPNGVVVYEEVSNTRKTPEIINQVKTNPFETKVEVPATPTEIPDISNKFKFDSNGVVIEDNSILENKKDIESKFQFVFDSNGFVTNETPKSGESAKKSRYTYQFDSNGFVTGVIDNEAENNPDDANTNTSSTPVYQFDSNGFVVSENASILSKESTPEINVPHYEFNENGIIIND
jgi:hypothetical protein